MNICDITPPQKFGTLSFPKLQGSCKIMLTDTVSNETQVIEGNNLITDAVKDIYSENPCSSIDYDYAYQPLATKMFGGILCFSKNLDQSANTYSIPMQDVNSITAHAGQDLPISDDDLSRGNPITSEFVYTKDSVTQVWEWDSRHGSGVISAIALCHTDLGNVGINCQSAALGSFFPIHFVRNSGFDITETYGNRHLLAYKEDIGYSFTCTNNVITIYKTPVEIYSTGILFRRCGSNPDHQIASDINISSGFNTVADCLYYFDLKNNILRLVGPTDANALKVITVNLLTNSASIETHILSGLTNSLWCPRFVSSYNQNSPCAISKTGNFIYYPICQNWNNGQGSAEIIKYIRINMQDWSFSEVSPHFSNVINTYSSYWGGAKINDCGITSQFITSIPIRALYFNGLDSYTSYEYSTPVVPNESSYYYSNNNVGIGRYDKYYVFGTQKLYLATKFNLPSPIKKTSHKLRIEYTLKEIPSNG